MECMFCEEKTCLANRHYHFLQGILINKMKSSNVDCQKMRFKFFTKYTEKIHGSKLGHQNCIPISHCITELICSFAPNKSGRYTGFWYTDSKMINQLDTCKLEDSKVFHIHV